MQNDKVLVEAKRLYDLGFAIHLLHPKSKRPIESGWTSGPRKSWKAIASNYRPGMNIGVRLGTPSKLKKGFLAVIDVDVKSSDAKHGKEVEQHLKSLLGTNTLPAVASGRGNGSRHYYILTPEPVKPFKAAQSLETVKVTMPSVAPSKRELKALTLKEIEAGIRLRPAWEVGVMGDGQQVVLPPSIHPDSGKAYVWKRPFDLDRAAKFDAAILKKSDNVDNSKNVDKSVDNVDNSKPGPKTLEGFEPEDIELSWLPIDEKIRAMILTGDGVEDRSAMLLPVSQSLIKAGLSINEVLSILTDPTTYMGKAAYEHAQTKNRVKAARWLYRYTVQKAYAQSSAESLFAAPFEEPKKLSSDKIAEQQELFDAEFDWRLDLDRTKNDTLRATLKNVLAIFENEIGEDFIRRDVFANREFYAYETPWGAEKNEVVKDEHAVNAKLWLSNNFGFEPPNMIIEEAHLVLARRNSFDPVLNFLEGLPKWDQKPRLDTWLIENFEAEAPTPAAREYLAQVFRKWLVAMVGRIYEPGLKFDWLPIFEGKQGIGKSSIGRILVGEEYFRDSLPDLHDKDASLALQGVWLVEFGELATMYKNTLETVKGFLTRTVDKVRPPFGRRTVETPRRCIFFGTTNHETYLRDETGNRRFKPVKVGRLNFEQLQKDREQLFAEAVILYKTQFQKVHAGALELTGLAAEYEAEIQGQKMVEDDSELIRQELLIFIENQANLSFDEQFDFDRFRMRDLFPENGKKSGFRPIPLEGLNMTLNSRSAQFAAKALKSLGFEKFKSNGVVYWRKHQKGIGFKMPLAPKNIPYFNDLSDKGYRV